MDVVSVQTARAAASRDRWPWRQRDLPGTRGLIGQMAAAPTISVAAASAYGAGATATAWNAPGAYTFTGCAPKIGTVFPDTLSCGSGGYSVSGTSASPYQISFEIETTDATGRFEIHLKPVSSKVRIAVATPDRKDFQYAGIFNAGTGGDSYTLVTMGAPGNYLVRLECDSNVRFYGVIVNATDTIRSLRGPSRRLIVLGDSYTEPTVVDSNTFCQGMGWVQQIGLMIGADAWSCGAGGTGYLATNTGTRPTFRGRLQDVIDNYRTGDEVWVAGGINDYSLFTAAQIGAEADLLFAAIKAGCPGVTLRVLSPFYSKQAASFPAGLLAAADAIKTSATAAGARFVDVLRLPHPNAAISTTLAASSAVNATSFSTAVPIPQGTYVQIGTGTTAEIRVTNGVSGSGPYTISLSGSGDGFALLQAHNSGEAVVTSGRCFLTGAGRQGATSGSGNADRYVGSDSTHPTGPGHLNIAMNVFWAFGHVIYG